MYLNGEYIYKYHECQGNVYVHMSIYPNILGFTCIWKQRAQIAEILQGDSNAKYFHAMVNGRRMKNRILSLDQDEGHIKGADKELITYVIYIFYDNNEKRIHNKKHELEESSIFLKGSYKLKIFHEFEKGS